MAATLKPFNSVGGFSIGEVPTIVIYANGDITTGNANVSTGNVQAGNLLTDNLLYANGQPWDLQEAAGANFEIQFNLSNNFSASPNLTFNSSTQVFTVIGNAAVDAILTDNYYYSNGQPVDFQQAAGANYEIQYNINDDFAASANFTYNDTTQVLTVNGNANVGGILTDNYYYANGQPVDFQQPAGSNTQVQFNDNNDFGANANFTFDYTGGGTLTLGLGNSGNIRTDNMYANVYGEIRELSVLQDANIFGNITLGAAELNEIVNLSNISLEIRGGSGNVDGQLALVSGNVSTENFAKLSLGGNNAGSNSYITANANIITIFNSNSATSTLIIDSINTNATSTSTGLIRANGGVGLTGNLHVGDRIVANLWENGNSNISLVANGNINISSAGTANVIKISDTDTMITGNVEISGGNILVSGSANVLSNLRVALNGNILGNLDAGNIATSGTLNVSQDAVINGNLTVGGNTTYINVETLTVEDPLIQLGGTANGGNASSYDGKDRGLLLHNYDSGNSVALNQAFIWKSANSEFRLISNVSSYTGEVVTGTLGNLRLEGLYGNLNGTVLTASQTFITQVGNLISLQVDGNANAANLTTSGVVSATGNVIGGNITTAGVVDATGNVIGGNITTAGIVNATGNVVGGNITTAGIVNATGNVIGGNITTSGLIVTTGNLSANNASITNNLGIGNTNINWATWTSTSTTANQTIATVSAASIRAVEFFVKGEESGGGKYSVSSVTAVHDGANVDYAVFGTVLIGGSTGSLAVNYAAGNITLDVTPASSNSTVWTTQYRTI